MQLEELKTKLQELADEVVVLQGQVLGLQAAVTAEIARLEALIASLKTQQGIDPVLLEPFIAQVQTTIDNLKVQGTAIVAAQAQLDAEQPAPPPAAEAAGA